MGETPLGVFCFGCWLWRVFEWASRGAPPSVAGLGAATENVEVLLWLDALPANLPRKLLRGFGRETIATHAL